MSFVLADRVLERTTSTGTGTVQLAGTIQGFQTFVAGIGDGNECWYVIAHQTAGEWEVGRGTVTDGSPDTLSRDTIIASSNGGAAVDFSAGVKDVWCDLPASEAETISASTLPVDDTTAVVRDPVDPTKLVRIDAGAIATATTRVLAMPDNDVNLAAGGTHLTKDGATPLSANWDAGSFEVRAQTFQSDVASGTAPLIVASTTLVSNLNADLLDGQHAADIIDSAARGLHESCRAATTADITLSGEQTIDGVSIVTGDRVLVKEQSTGSENGIYVADSSTWSRASDMAAAASVAADFVFIKEGTAHADTGWLVTNNAGSDVVDTDALTFVQFTDNAGNTLAGLSDVQIGTPSDNELFAYDATLGKWTHQTAAAAGVAPATHTHSAADVTSGTLAHERGGLEADVSAYGGVPLINSGATSELKYNLAASSAPGVSHDSAAGYAVGSIWIDTSADKAYICLDASAGAAVWKTTTDVIATANVGDLSNVEISAVTDNEVFAYDSASGKWKNQTAAEAGLATAGGGVTGLNAGGPNSLTISSGAITVVASISYYEIDTEGAASTDDLTDISGGNVGQVIILKAKDASHTVAIQHNGAKIALQNSDEYKLNFTDQHIALLKVSSTVWRELFRSHSRWNVGTGSTLTISSGAVDLDTLSGKPTYVQIDTESSASTDDLDTIDGGETGDVIILQAANDTRTVVCKGFTGNLALVSDFSLDSDDDVIMLAKLDSGTWYEISRADLGT